jgi:hypothetical protein
MKPRLNRRQTNNNESPKTPAPTTEKIKVNQKLFWD